MAKKKKTAVRQSVSRKKKTAKKKASSSSAGPSKPKKTGKSKAEKKTKAKSGSRPQTMAELLSQTGYKLRGFKRGDEIEGTIVEKTKKVLYLDIGGKSEGMVIDREMKAAEEYIKTLNVGDRVEVIVTQPENDRGQTLLSLKKAASDHVWGFFEEKLETGGVIKVQGKEVNRGGLIVNARGLQGFVPGSQFGSELSGQVKQLTNQELEVKAIEVDREKNRLIFSEREVSEADLLKAQKEALGKVKIGDVFEGEVIGVMSFGLFVKVDVGKKGKKKASSKIKKAKKKKSKAKPKEKEDESNQLEGLVHISEISWEKVDDPNEYYKEKDEVKVQVLGVDEKSGKLNLSIKQLKPDPWEKIEKKYPIEGKVKGEVVKLAPFGAFVHLEPGIEGLIHLSKIPVEKSLKVGDKVSCYIESIDKENRRMSLGLVLTQKPVAYK